MSFPLPKFTPVARKNTVSHGWTPDKQRGFIEALAASGSVRVATEAVGMSHCGVYKLRNAAGAASFVRAWDTAVSMGAARVRDVLMDQAVNGVPDPVFFGGEQVGERRRFNHRTMMWVLQHHMPDAYPGGSTTHRGRWGKGAAAEEISPEAAAELRAQLIERLDRLAEKLEQETVEQMVMLGADPVQRAAIEALHGQVPWDDLPGYVARWAENRPLGALLPVRVFPVAEADAARIQ